ncbi:hypothetical protein OGM63_16595 [Plectonema radiosum NIES-515]|uniref:Uncharacterized protein n=1 Tax=Plectonema radiosum NIES-515 TaxID=2986073 RepID=A0ABT3B174_9CYAN|nr:hypothetical protein [Plectonema radiosum]MCV3215112.1 hypothetical protein [Plectonema radiosum NIES-515]
MFNWLSNLFDDKELREISERLDAKEKALDERIAEKEAYLNELKTNVEKGKETIQRLQKLVNREAN